MGSSLRGRWAMPPCRQRSSNWKRPPLRPLRSRNLNDRLFRGLTLAFAVAIIGITALIAWQLWIHSRLAQAKFGLSFLYGTLVTSAIALVLAVPLGVGTAIFLAELAPPQESDGLTFLVELLAAIPSVIYGLVGMFVVVPWVRHSVEPALSKTLGFLPLFQGAPYGVGFLTAGLILAIMIVPFITSVSREVLLAVPRVQREAALALGATRWEVLRVAIIPYARSGIVASILLAMARALGETMAVTMVIGNRPQIVASLFQPGHTPAAVLANEFTEATSDLYLNALIEIGLVLFCVTMLVNGLARILLARLRVQPGRR